MSIHTVSDPHLGRAAHDHITPAVFSAARNRANRDAGEIGVPEQGARHELRPTAMAMAMARLSSPASSACSDPTPLDDDGLQVMTGRSQIRCPAMTPDVRRPTF